MKNQERHPTKRIVIKVAKWLGIGLLTLLMLTIAVYICISSTMEGRMDHVYHFKKRSIAVRLDSPSIIEGKRLVLIKGCVDCHGADLSGKVMVKNNSLGTLASANLTRGKGGLPQDYNTADWVMALKHGVGKDGRPLLIMPSHETTHLNEKDLSAILAYCNVLPPVDHVVPKSKIGPLGKTLAFMGKLPLISVDKIDHSKASSPQAEAPASLMEKGRYLTVFCTGCHRPNFKGGDGLIPGAIKIPNITASGNPGKWTEDQFQKVLKTGLTPEGHQMKNEDMPWEMTASYTNEEIKAIFTFLRSQN